MKCTHCGFTYEEETVCPICGTPAPCPETAPEEPFLEMTGAPAAEPQPPEPPAPAPHRQAGRMQIAILCVLAAIAALLLYLAVLGSVAFAWMLSDYGYWYDTWEGSGNSGYAEPAPQKPDVNNDGTVYKIGEPYDFGSGTLTLKGAAVVKPKASFDATQRLVAFTVEINNTTKQEQLYHAPEFVLGSSDFDASHFAFSEFSANGDGEYVSFQPGETYAAVFYYNLPNEKQTLLATVFAESDATGAASAAYNISLADIK